MDVYVLKGGRRTGPFLPFKLREMLEDGEISPSDLGWIEGMEEWIPMEKMEAISDWMPRKPGAPPPLPSAKEWDAHLESVKSPAGHAPADLTSPYPSATVAGREERNLEELELKSRPLRAFQRWAARFTDSALWFALIWVVGVEAGWMGLWEWLPENSGLLTLMVVPLLWLPVEATFLALVGTTPGKWCFGIRITDDLGQKLSWISALKRAALAHVAGNGLGLPSAPRYFLPILQWSISWIFYRHSGTTLWDRLSRSEVRHVGVPPLGMVTVGMAAFGWMAVLLSLVMTAPIPEDFPEDQRWLIEEQRRQFQETKKEWEKQQRELNSQPAPTTTAAPNPTTAAPDPQPAAVLPEPAPAPSAAPAPDPESPPAPPKASPAPEPESKATKL